MRKLVLMSLSVLLLLFVSGSAYALQYAVDDLWSGTNVEGSARQDMANALGAPDGDFLSLGMGGSAVFDFGTDFDATAIVFETTWGDRDIYPEYANVYVGNTYSLNIEDGFILVATIQNDVEENIIDLSGLEGSPFRYVLVVDVTAQYPDGINGDGFDIDAVAVSPVPEPSTMFLLGVGLVGLAGARRKIKK